MTAKYIAVVGKSDHIKHGVKPVLRPGERDPRPHVPVWDYLDVQPAGWLNSLAYARSDLPVCKEKVGDCGAWTYRMKDVPVLRGQLLTPATALRLYGEAKLQRGARIIGPDHMLIQGLGDVDARREFNRASAAEFLGLCADSPYRPMAAVHGLTTDERVEEAVRLRDIGYASLALGGLAGQAGRWAECVEAVEAVRAAVPEVHLHVLGLSAPSYATEWARIGVDTFDGATFYRAAFANGVYYMADGANLVKHSAARPGETPTAPICHCRTCTRLREQGVDTRSYGSNEHNMGRAVHNLNHHMRAVEAAMQPAEPPPVVLVSCVQEKVRHPVAARWLYSSAWFTKARRFAEQRGGPWFILSAAHGVVAPDTVIAPYDTALHGQSRDVRREWAERCAGQVFAAVEAGRRVEILAGALYREYLAPALERAGYRVSVPMEGLEIGEQLAWLTAATRDRAGAVQTELFAA